MQLKIQRSQRTGGLTGSTVFFSLDVRADYSPEEQENIRRYKLGSQAIYNSRAAKKHLEGVNANLERSHSSSVGEQFAGIARGAFSLALAKMSLNITIASLGRGHHIECKDLDELLEAEDEVRGACKHLTRYLDTAATFDGGETVIEYEGGEERVHVAENAPPLIAPGAMETSRVDGGPEGVPVQEPPQPQAYRPFAESAYEEDKPNSGANGWGILDDPQMRILAVVVAVVIILIIIGQLHS